MTNVDFNMVGCVLTLLGSSYIFFRNFRNDIRSDMRKFEERWQIMDEKHEKHRESMDEKWYALLKEIHKLNKRGK